MQSIFTYLKNVPRGVFKNGEDANNPVWVGKEDKRQQSKTKDCMFQDGDGRTEIALRTGTGLPLPVTDQFASNPQFKTRKGLKNYFRSGFELYPCQLFQSAIPLIFSTEKDGMFRFNTVSRQQKLMRCLRKQCTVIFSICSRSDKGTRRKICVYHTQKLIYWHKWRLLLFFPFQFSC